MPESSKILDNRDSDKGIEKQPLTEATDSSAKIATAQAIAEIKTTMSPLTRGSEFTEVIRVPNLGTTVNFYANGTAYPARVTNIVESDKGPMITVEADPSYPGPNKKITCTLEQFNMLAGTKKSVETLPTTKATEKIVDTKVPDTVLDSINDLVVQETLSRFDGKEIPQSIIEGQLVIIKSELAEAGHADEYINVSREVQAIFAEHNADIAAKTTKTVAPETAPSTNENERKARAEQLEKIMQLHPELEGSIATLDKKVQGLLTSKEWGNDTQLDPLQQITAANSPVTAYLKVLDEAQGLAGMTPEILEALKNKWGKEINRQAELAPQLIKLSRTINEQLAKTETLIDAKGLNEIASAVATIPGISKQQKDLLLVRASKQVVIHNESVQAIQAARIALENQLKPNTNVDRTTALAAIDQIANLSDDERTKLKASFNDRIDAFENAAKKPRKTPPPLPSQATKIDDVPEVRVSDPDFNKKVDNLDEIASKLLQSMSNSSTSDLIDTDAFTKLLVAELKKQNVKTDSKEAIAWLSAQQETAYQINKGIENLNQENEHIDETTANCHQDIDTLLDSPDCSTLEEIAAIQAKINTLPDTPEKTDLQNRLTEIEAHDQAILKADELIQNALASKVETSNIDLKIAIQTLLPAKAGEDYWKVAEELIDEHNQQLQNLSAPEAGSEDQPKIDALVNECNDKVSAILISGELASIADIAALQTKIDSIADTDTKAGLQKNISELLDYNQALKQADALMETALDTKALIDGNDLKKKLEKLIPTAIEQYWNAAEEIITEHNTTIYQINKGSETLKAENERIDETTADCHQDIDALLDSPDCSTLEEIAAIQAKINTLPDSPEKTDLQNRLTEIEAHDQAILKADELIQNALASKVETSSMDLMIAIQTLLPAKAGEHYWKVAEELIDEHNKQLQNLTAPEAGSEDQTKIDALVNECNDKVSAILISGELASIADIATLQTKIDSIADTDTKAGLQKNISELLDYNQALKQADALMETALATKTLIDGNDLKKNLEKLIPTAIEQYWNAAEEIITEHNTTISAAPNPSPDAVATVVDVPVVPPTARPDTAPQADVLGATPVDTKIEAPVDVLNKVDATPLSAEQIAKRDEMFGLIEKNLILTEEEKGRMMVKVMELLRTASRDTNVKAELQKLMASQDRHQEIQRQLNEKSPIFAMIVQDAVQSALNTNDLNYKANEAEYQKMLSDLPTDAAKKAMQAVYDAAIGDKKLRGDLKAIQAQVEQVLANQANFSDARNDSLEPLFKRMNVIVKTGLPRESQVLGSQTIAPDVGQWEAPPTDEQPESLRDKAKRKFLELFDRLRGKKTETVEAETDTTNDLDVAYIKTPTEIIDNLVASNVDLTTAEKADLKATALELLEKGTDISKTVEKLKATLAERSRVNREISALVLNAPELSKQMYFALSAALNDEMTAPKRTEALTQWQSFVDQLPTDRAKAAVKAVYQEALKNKALRSDVNALEEKIAEKLASTGIDDREKALNSLINTLGSEINRAISTRKPSETVVDQAPAVAEAAVVPAAEVLTDAPKTTVENKDEKLNQALTDRIISMNLNSEGKKRDVTPQEFFGSDMDQLIKTMEVENDQNLNTELKAIRQLLVDSKPGVMIGTEATDRLTAALKTKYPEVLDNIMGYINIHIQEHDVRTAMQAEINAKGTELKAKIDTLSSADVSAEIRALHQKFASRINPFGVDQALFPLNDALQERVHNTEAAVKAIDQLWKNPDEPSLALDKVATILSNNQLDNTIQLSLIEFAKNIAPIVNKPGNVSSEELGNIIFQIIPQTTNLPPALKSALVNKVKVMISTHNKTVGKNPQQQVA